ncbi:MAG: cob(I)yrinic acid a,c-diamide adenosyltransferase [Chloroflexi bacterium]|nr:cob(I)yrinic acid a,c-diamide adenosyltransferase [Chloroflexota bacterium]
MEIPQTGWGGRGLVQLYTGNGKGKTTAALGLVLRAAGWGLRSYIAQFLKGQDYGELHSVARLAPLIVLEQFGTPNCVRTPSAQDRALAHSGLVRAQQALTGGKFTIVILDEICAALSLGLVALDEVTALIDNRPPDVELVLTGRNAPPELVERADLVTEMTEIRHPYSRGIGARVGIER